MIYFDHNATTPIDELVLEAMQPFLTTFYGNPSSLYRQGRIVRSAIDTAREQVAALIDAQPNQVVFTSGGTEANNLALHTVKPLSKLAVSAIEHPSVMVPAKNLQGKGCELAILPVDSGGLITPSAISQLIGQQVGFVSIMLANNETGVLQPLAEIVEMLRPHKIAVHTDAVQALGKIRFSFQQLGVQFMTLSSHKLYGPKGCGALVYSGDDQVQPLITGGGQERGLRAGTENVAAIVGFGKAAELAANQFAHRQEHLLKLRRLFELLLATVPGIRIFAGSEARLPNTVQFGVEGVDGEMLLMGLDKKNIAVSSGSACASGGLEPSPVLVAMGMATEVAKTAIRVSFGITNTEAEILEFINVLKALILV